MKKKRKTKLYTDELNSKIYLNEIRKEKLKMIASKEKSIPSSSKTETRTGPVAAKVTKKNRFDHLMDSICRNDEETNVSSTDN